MPSAAHGRLPSRAHWLVLGAILALKAGYLFTYLGLPFAWGPVFDSVVYLEQAAAVSRGDFGHPTLLAMSPLYGYFLVVAGVGQSPLAPLVLQLMLGLATAHLIYRIGAQLLDETAGIAAMVLFAGYGPVVFHETKLLTETLALNLLALGFLLYLSPAFRAGRWSVSVPAGSLLGLAVLARASLLFTAPLFVIAAFLPWGDGHGPLPRGRRGLGVALGLGLVLLGNGAWNHHHTGLFVPVILVSRTVETSTKAPFDGTLNAYGRGGVGPSAWDVVRQADERIEKKRQGEPDPAAGPPRIDVEGIVRGAPAKLLRLFGNTETTFEYGFYGERTEVWPLRAFPVPFLTLCFGALIALWLTRRNGFAQWIPFLPILVGITVTVLLFHPSSRYRLPLVVALAPLGGLAVGELQRRWSTFIRPREKLSVLVVVAGAVVLPAVSHGLYPLRSPASWELRVAEAAVMAGDLPEAERRLARATPYLAADAGAQGRAAYVAGLIRQRRSAQPGGPPGTDKLTPPGP